MKLLDYYRLRDDEERSWNLPQLEQDAARSSPEFIQRVAELMPVTREDYVPGGLINIQRNEGFDRIARLCRVYLDATDTQRTYMRSRVARVSADRLESFGLRSAVLGAREHSEEAVRLGLTAFAIADLQSRDVRDVLIGLTLVHHCAKLAGADANGLFRDAATRSGPAMSALFSDYAARDPSLQTLACMGLYEVTTPDGVGFTTIPPKH